MLKGVQSKLMFRSYPCKTDNFFNKELSASMVMLVLLVFSIKHCAPSTPLLYLVGYFNGQL